MHLLSALRVLSVPAIRSRPSLVVCCSPSRKSGCRVSSMRDSGGAMCEMWRLLSHMRRGRVNVLVRCILPRGDTQRLLNWHVCVPKFWGRRVTRPAVPYFLALAGLPFIQLYAAMKDQPALYSRNSLDLLRDCPVSVDESSARRQLGYESRPLEESIRDALNWFKEQGMCL